MDRKLERWKRRVIRIVVAVEFREWEVVKPKLCGVQRNQRPKGSNSNRKGEEGKQNPHTQVCQSYRGLLSFLIRYALHLYATHTMNPDNTQASDTR